MSLEKLRTGDQPSHSLIGEGRREGAGQQPAPPQRSGGVGVDGTSASSTRESWEVSSDGCKTQPTAQAGQASEAGGAAGEVGILHSSEEAPVMGVESRRDTCSRVRSNRWPMAPQGDKPPRGASSLTLTRSSLRQRGNGIELGEPNMGNPSVRFDEGRERAGHWRQRLSIQPLLPTLPNQGLRQRSRLGTRVKVPPVELGCSRRNTTSTAPPRGGVGS